MFARDDVLGQMQTSMEADMRGRGGCTNAALLLQIIQAPSTERPLRTQTRGLASEFTSVRARQKKRAGPKQDQWRERTLFQLGLTC